MQPVTMKWLVTAGALALVGCITPHSMALGQLAAGVGRGATEVGVFTGLQYGEQLNPAVAGVDVAGDPTSTQTRTRAFGLPSAEANLQYGFSDQVGLNVHASPAGLQPGLKLTLNKSRVANVALLPAVGVGYSSVLSSNYVAGVDGQQVEGPRTATTSFTFVAGLKLLFSHRSGFYAGVGYDLLLHNAVASTANSATTDRQETRTFTLEHQLMAALGIDIAFGLVHLRPEIAFAVMPGISQTLTSVTGTTPSSVTNGGGFGWALFPGFSLAVATPVKPKSEAEEEEEDRPKRDAEGEDESSDENENPKIKARARRNAAEGEPRKRGHDDDEDDEKPQRRKTDDDD